LNATKLSNEISLLPATTTEAMKKIRKVKKRGFILVAIMFSKVEKNHLANGYLR
jgi:hypothetical protein